MSLFKTVGLKKMFNSHALASIFHIVRFSVWLGRWAVGFYTVQSCDVILLWFISSYADELNEEQVELGPMMIQFMIKKFTTAFNACSNIHIQFITYGYGMIMFWIMSPFSSHISQKLYLDCAYGTCIKLKRCTFASNWRNHTANVQMWGFKIHIRRCRLKSWNCAEKATLGAKNSEYWIRNIVDQKWYRLKWP